MTIKQRTLEEQQKRQHYFDVWVEAGGRKSLLKEEIPDDVLYDYNSYALLYTVSGADTTGTAGNKIRFAMSVEDAMKFCKDERTQGLMYGSKWFYCFTQLETYMSINDGVIDVRKQKDNGKYDAIMDELGVTKYPITQFKELFEPLGYKVLI